MTGHLITTEMEKLVKMFLVLVVLIRELLHGLMEEILLLTGYQMLTKEELEMSMQVMLIIILIMKL